jgi:hypothetical protein
MLNIKLVDFVSSFAENKDVAQSLRKDKIIPALEKGDEVTLDFAGVDSATQSFVHALISDVIRILGNDIIDKISFKNCNETIKKIIEIVIDYMQES